MQSGQKPIKAILFDLFHTLISMSHQGTPGRNSYEILGVAPEIWNDAVFNKTRNRLCGRIRDPIAIIRDITDSIDATFSDSLIEMTAENRANRFRHALMNAPARLVRVLGLLRKRFKLGLVSNADAAECAHWSVSPLGNSFDCAIFSCDVGFAKPDPEIYLCCLNRLGVRPAEALFVGDGASDELQGAKAVGLTTVFTSEYLEDINPGVMPERIAMSDHQIDNIEQLLCLLE